MDIYSKDKIFFITKLKLTATYISIISIILVGFSSIIYLEIKKDLYNSLSQIFPVNKKQAIIIINERYHNKELKTFKLDNNDGHLVYLITFTDGDTATIDALTGLSVEDQTKYESFATEFMQNFEDLIIFINIFTLIFVILISYFLAKRTLNPIAEKMKAEEQFISDAAHELRNPLSVIILSAQVLLDNSVDIGDKDQILKGILYEAKRLSKHTDSLLDLSNISTKLQHEQCHIKEVVEEVVNRLSIFSNQKLIKVNMKIEDFTFNSNKISVESLLYNIIHNAIKFSNKGGEININSTTSRTLTISDNGIGLKTDNISKIFDRYYKTDTSREFLNGGVGLGLSIVQKISREQNIKITVESALNKGTKFTLKFNT